MEKSLGLVFHLSGFLFPFFCGTFSGFCLSRVSFVRGMTGLHLP